MKVLAFAEHVRGKNHAQLIFRVDPFVVAHGAETVSHPRRIFGISGYAFESLQSGCLELAGKIIHRVGKL